MDMDMNAAVAEIGTGLFGGQESTGSAGAGGKELPDGENLENESNPPAPAPEPAPAPAPAPTPAPAPAPATGNAPAPAPGAPTPSLAPTPGAPGAPSTWRPEAQAKWESIDPVIKAEIIKREEDAMRGIGQYRAAAQVGETFNRVLTPHMPLLKQYNVDPVQNINTLMTMQATLVTGTPEQKVGIIRQLIQGYGVDVAQLDPDNAPYVDPAVSALQNEIQSLKSQLQGVQASKVSEVQTTLRSEIDAFASDKANVYFDEVADTMAGLLRSGQATTLKEAYDTAIWMNPAVRAKEQARLDTERQAKAQADAEAATKAAASKTAAARKATGVNVRTRATPEGKPASTKGASIDETLESTYAAILARG